MRYSLLSRFTGTLLGAALGEIYGNGYKGRSRVAPRVSKSRLLPSANLKLGPKESGENVEINHTWPWSQMALMSAQSLIRCGRFDLDEQSRLASPIGAVSSSALAIATLPVSLFFHENQVTLQQQLTLASATWQGASSNPPVAAVGYAIALSLTEKLNPATLITQILAYLQDAQTPLVQQLAQVETLLEQGASLEIASTQLNRHSHASTTPIALAFYCFLSTPEDFGLSVTRAMRAGYQPQITAALTGALSGVYNSFTGIPLDWRLAFNRIDKGETQQLAGRLFAIWSGVYDTTTVDRCQQVAVAAPRVLKPRHDGLSIP